MAKIDLSAFELLCRQVPCPACGGRLTTRPDPTQRDTVIECSRCDAEPLRWNDNTYTRSDTEKFYSHYQAWSKRIAKKHSQDSIPAEDETMWLSWCNE
jgi:hypothetical protein